MVLIGKINDTVYYSRKPDEIPYELRKGNNKSFECLHCKGKLTFINKFTRCNGSVAAYFRHNKNMVCNYEHHVENHLSIDVSDFHKSWTSDIVKSQFLFGYWYKQELYDIKNTVDEYIFVKHSLVGENEVLSKEKYSENKVVWILDWNTRQGTLCKQGGNIYINFNGKVDIPSFTSKSKVYLDGGYTMLLEIRLGQQHCNLGYKVSLINITNVLSLHFKNLLKDYCEQRIIENRNPFDVEIYDAKNLIFVSKSKPKNFIVEYELIENHWVVKQGKEQQEIPFDIIPETTYLMKGMKIERLSDKYVTICLPDSIDAISEYFNEFQYEKHTNIVKQYEQFCYFVEQVQKQFEFEMDFRKAITNVVGFEDIKELNLKKLQNISQVNIYNEILSGLHDKCKFTEIQQKIILRFSMHIKNSSEFLHDPYTFPMQHLKYNKYKKINDDLDVLEFIAISINVSIEKQCLARLRYCLFQAKKDGHSCMSINDICHKAQFVTSKKHISQFQFYRIIKDYKNYYIVYLHETERVYLKDVYDQECKIVNVVTNFMQKNRLCSKKKVENKIIDEGIQNYKKNNAMKFNFNYQQDKAIRTVLSKNLTLICGKPGSGKSDVVNAICYILIESYGITEKDILLCALSGKAASKLRYTHYNKIRDIEPKTIHKALYETLPKNQKKTSDSDDDEYSLEKEFCELQYKVIIADEVSMLDTDVFSKFLSCINIHNTKVVLIGDHHQLPSIKYGDVLKSLYSCRDKLNFVELHEVYRYGEDMKQLAQSITNGNELIIKDCSEIQWHKIKDISLINDEIMKIYRNAEEKKKTTQIIVPTNDNELSCKTVNTFFHNSYQKLNSNIYPNQKFFFGENVICTQNNKHAMKGDFLFAGTKYNYENELLVFKKQEEVEHFNLCDTIKDEIYIDEKLLDYSYSITIHKSQGSEFDIVIVIIHSGYHLNMMNRNLLYTAVTRTKEQLHVFYDSKNALQKCIKKTLNRETCLSHLLYKALSKIA